MVADPPRARNQRYLPHPVFWMIGGSLLTLCVILLLRGDVSGLGLNGTALAQAVTSGGARGVFAFSGQLSKNTYGVYVIDVDAMTIWAYEHLPEKGCLRLAAARTWRYDRYLENYNICDLAPEAVEKMIEDQRQYRLQSAETQSP